MIITLGLSADHVARFDKETMSDQMLLELIVAEMAGRIAFWDSDADDFHPLHEWKGFTFSENANVCKVQWHHYNIDPAPRRINLLAPPRVNPNILGGTISLKWLPLTVTSCIVHHLQLEGTIETGLLPQGLIHLEIPDNKLSGHFDTSGLPVSIEDIDLSRNRFEGKFDITSLPQTVKSLSINQNSFSGTLDVVNLPEALSTIWIYDNQLEENNDIKLPEGFRYIRYGFDRTHGEKGEGISRIA